MSTTPWPQRTPPPVRKRKAKPATVPEWCLQAAFIAELHALEAAGWPITCAGDMGAGKRSYAQAARDKATGLTAGEPDVRVYLPGGRTILVELKTDTGKVSKAQTARHTRLRELDHPVTVVQLKDQNDARIMARVIIGAWVLPAARSC